MEGAKSKLILRGFKEENILMAKLDELAVLETMLQWFGSTGDYVAMVWPPGKPREIIVSQIVENKQSRNKSSAPGAWEALQQNELYRIPLK